MNSIGVMCYILISMKVTYHRYIFFIIPVLVYAFTFPVSCRYDKENIDIFTRQQRIVPADVLNEVRVLTKLHENSIYFDEELHMYLPVTDAFNDPDKETSPRTGGTIRTVFTVEPKRLTRLMDTSAVTSNVNDYIFNGLLYQDPLTLEYVPDLAESYVARDIIWLKGHRENAVFGEEGENNYIIVKIKEDGIVEDEEGNILEIHYIKDGNPGVVAKDRLRKKSNHDGTYIRSFDREVVFTFNIRQGVKWHDGHPFSAHDVVFTLDVIMNPRIPEVTPFRSTFRNMKHYEAIGDDVVIIYLDEQYFKAIELFSTFILPRHVFIPEGQSFTDDEFAGYFRDHPAIDQPVGTGPYALPSPHIKEQYRRGVSDGWRKGNYIQLNRTGDFYDSDRRGYLDTIYIYIITDADAILRAMMNDEVDACPRGLGSEDIFKKSNTASFKRRFVKGFFYTGNFNYIALNTRTPYFSDRRVRQAISLLLPSTDLLENLSYGVGIEVTGSQYVLGPLYDHSIEPLGYDPQRAVELLNEAGWIDSNQDGIRDKDGLPFRIEYMGTQSSLVDSIMAVLHQNLSNVGIDLSIRRMEWASLLEHIDERQFDMYSLGWTIDIENDPFDLWHSSQWENRGQNTIGYNNPEADRLIEKFRRELDIEKRRAIWQQIHRIIYEDQPYIFLYCYPNRFAYHKKFRNVNFYAKRPGYFLWEWYIDDEWHKD